MAILSFPFTHFYFRIFLKQESHSLAHKPIALQCLTKLKLFSIIFKALHIITLIPFNTLNLPCTSPEPRDGYSIFSHHLLRLLPLTIFSLPVKYYFKPQLNTTSVRFPTRQSLPELVTTFWEGQGL